MAREDLHFRLRIPEALKSQIEDAAAANNRSMTSEMISRLEKSFTSEKTIDQLWKRVEALEHEINKHKGELEDLTKKSNAFAQYFKTMYDYSQENPIRSARGPFKKEGGE